MPNETYDWDAIRERLRKRADEGFPASWQPEEVGDELLGVVRRVVLAAPTRQYGTAAVVELETEVGARYSVWLFHKVLRQAFIRERVQLGELVLIRWLGKKTPEGGGNSYDNYEVVVDRPEATGSPDWDAVRRATSALTMDTGVDSITSPAGPRAAILVAR